MPGLGRRAADALRSRVDPDEASQAELVRRVMALDGREHRLRLRLRNAELETAVDALDECTSVPRQDILDIARDIVREQVGGRSARALSAPTKRLVAPAAVTLAAMSLVLAFGNGDEPALTAPPSGPVAALPGGQSIDAELQRRYLDRARLMSAFSEISTIRMMVMQHDRLRGEFPSSLADIGLDADTLTSRRVAGVGMEGEGVIVVRLPDDLGADKRIRLSPTRVMGGMSIEWDCLVNLPEPVLQHSGCEAG